MLGVDVEVIVVDGERLRALGDAGHKLLHLKEDVGLLADIELPHRYVGGRYTIYVQRREGDETACRQSGTANHRQTQTVLLDKSGATLSMVTSRFPRITGSLAIFSGLREGKKRN